MLGDMDYALEITSFDKDSSKRKAVGSVKIKDKFNTTCEIIGSIEDDCFVLDSYENCYGSSYHVYASCEYKILENIKNELNNKYSFVVNDDTDYEVLAKDIKSYIKDLKKLYMQYDDMFEKYYDTEYSYAQVNIIINNEKVEEYIYIDDDNGLVIIDFSQGKYGWKGELELSEYLKLLANGELQEKIDEIRMNHYGRK